MKTISIVVCMLLLSLVPASSQHAKDKAPSKTKKVTPPAKPHKIWILSFELTIKGDGQTKPEEEGDLEAWWDIDRTYSGMVELNTPMPTSVMVTKGMSPGAIIAALESAPVMWTYSGTAGETPDEEASVVWVHIKDKMRRKVEDKGEGGSFENTTFLNYWEGEGTTRMKNATQLVIDTNKSKYNVTIPLDFIVDKQSDRLLKFTTDKLIERSAFGYGDAPTSEPSEHVQNRALSTMEFPLAMEVLDNSTIHPGNDLPFKLVQGHIEWDSGDVKIDEPLFKDPLIRESQEGIMVHVHFDLRQMTGK